MCTDRIAVELNRLFADNGEIVDSTEISWGHGTMAGHIGHDDGVIGWYTDGGNHGHPLVRIHEDDQDKAVVTLKAMDRCRNIGEVWKAFTEAGIRFERLV